MQKYKAMGIDGITKGEYGKHLEENLEKLVQEAGFAQNRGGNI